MALNDLPPYTEALEAWLASNRQDESQLLQGKALQDAKAWVVRQSSSEPYYQFLIASQALEKRELLKELEIARQAAQDPIRLRGEFLSNMSNELRTPINGIVGCLTLIMEGCLEGPEEERELIHETRLCALHVIDMLNDLLDMTNVEAGHIDTELGSIKLYELLSEVEKSVKTLTQEKHLSFQIIKPTTQEILVYGDRLYLLRVMERLMKDAIQSSSEGEITISVEVIEEKVMVQNQEGSGLVKIHLADNRNKSQKDYLLSFLSQMNGFPNYWCGSSEMGLILSKTWMEAMGGELNIDNRDDGLGLTVTITLPLYQALTLN